MPINLNSGQIVKKRTFDSIGRDDPRIIIPMYDEKKNLIGFQGRALDKSPNKYITIMINEEAPKIYGLETINTKFTDLCGRRTL